MAAPRKMLSTQEDLDAVLDSSDEDESISCRMADSDDLYQSSPSDGSDSTADIPSSDIDTEEPLQPRVSLPEPSHIMSSLALIEDECHLPRTIAMEYGNIDLPSTYTTCQSAAVNEQPATELTTCFVEELPLPPTPSPLSPLSDSDDFPLPPPPVPLPPLLNDDDFIFPPAPPPIFTNDTITPLKKLTRKRKRNEKDWKRNTHSKKHNTGQEKIIKGQSHGRKIEPPCSESCKRMCSKNFNEDKRVQIFNTHWGMSSKKGRRDFIVSHVHEVEKKRSVGRSDRRKATLIYMLPSEGSTLQVCKKMYLSTLDISDNMVRYNLKQSVCNVVQPKPKPEPKNKISQLKLDTIKSHIESFPKVESHYCRADSKKEYLDATLNIRQIYRLYCQKYTTESCVSEHKYREIFNTQYNLSFHHPSKDTCDTCKKFTLVNSPTEEENVCFEAHLRRKFQAREHKNADKLDGSKVVASFDLQQVISCPKLNVSNAYYLRKLNVYNFTLLNLQSLQGDCYTWTEYECNRGANDIASCVSMWLREIDHEGGKHVVFFSDCCGGQNRNRIMIAALCKFLSNSLSIAKIEQKFFESGHSKNECDSMHSAIQNDYSKADVFLPSGFHQHMKQAHHSKPYNVHTMMHSDMQDFGKLNTDHMKTSAFTGIQKVHHIIYEKDDDNVNLYFSEEIGGEPQSKSFLKRGHTQLTFRNANVSPAYDGPCGIDNDKKRDIIKLCNYIPEDCRLYYNSL